MQRHMARLVDLFFTVPEERHRLVGTGNLPDHTVVCVLGRRVDLYE